MLQKLKVNRCHTSVYIRLNSSSGLYLPRLVRNWLSVLRGKGSCFSLELYVSIWLQNCYRASCPYGTPKPLVWGLGWYRRKRTPVILQSPVEGAFHKGGRALQDPHNHFPQRFYTCPCSVSVVFNMTN